jgi:2-polyprenyl-3-methyl-5-hydroxy-6-metoxy-1,4-benzoquinol methylase
MPGSLERLSFKDLETTSSIQEETIRLHKERYEYAAKFIKGMRVLDLACGVGYGSALMRDSGATSVVGVDIDPGAINEAQELQSRDGVFFFCADYRDIVERTGSDARLARAFEERFDVIVSLETIEHLQEPEHFLHAMSKYLCSGGILVVSAPVTPSVDGNPYHLHDFSARSFQKMIEEGGLKILEKLRQRQPFNPLSVRKEMFSGRREGLRENLAAFYWQHPSKLMLRLSSTLRYGFANLIDTVVAKKV